MLPLIGKLSDILGERALRIRLDDLYQMVAYIYHDSNMARSKEEKLLHFVAVCGMLTMLDR